MKAKMIIFSTMAFLLSTACMGQEISQQEVPSIILNHFKKNFPKATDIDWELKSDLYQVEFEVDKNREQEIWYDTQGVVVKEEVEISRHEIPEKILAVIEKEYSRFQLEEVKKVRENKHIEYHLDLESKAEDWDVVFTPDGELLSKMAD